MTAASEALIRAQVADLLEKAPDAQVIALGAEPRWEGPERLVLGPTTVRVVACRSPLAIHAAMRDFDAERSGTFVVNGESGEEIGPLVILTDLDDDDIGADIRARILKCRVIPLSRWQAVLAAFSANRLDPRIADRQDLADALVELAPVGGYAPSPSGFLDRDTAARALVAVVFGTGVPDGPVADLVSALSDVVTVGRAASAPPAALAEAFAWLRTRLGSPVDLIEAAVSAGQARNVPALSLVAGVAWAPRAIAEAPAEAAAVAVRLEPYFGAGVDPAAAQAFGDAGAALVGNAAMPFEAVTKDAEALLSELRGEALLWASPLLPAGFERRLVRLGNAIEAALDGPTPTPAALAAVARCAADVEAHRQADFQPARAAAAAMAARLTRRLANPQADPSPNGLAAAASAYAAEGSFADWALEVLRSGEDIATVADAYRRVLARVSEDRGRQDRHFAEELARWAPAGASTANVILVEEVLERVVMPLAQAGPPVLLVVIDGMSLRVHNELVQNLLDGGWGELGRGTTGDRLSGVAAFPTVTSVSRTSLLCGTLGIGDNSTEKAGFPLVAGPGSVVWHKPDLHATDGLSLPPEVAASLDAVRGPAVVGVVVNTVDDHLLKGDQISLHWRVDALGPLGAILRAARGRTVVLTADHGHIAGVTSARVAEGGGERWRPNTGRPPGDDEVVLTGRRVLLGDGTVIMPWTDDVRYSAGARHGYHGGASPKEVVVPVSVLVQETQDIDGWVDIPAYRPPWWDEAAPVRPEVTVPAAAAARRRSTPTAAPSATPQLFDAEPTSTWATTPDDWIAALQASVAYRAQVAAAARLVPSDDWVRKALGALAPRGGALPLSALAEATGSSALRTRGLVSGLSTLLNVDGYLVVRVDETAPGGTVILDKALLAAQFGVIVP